MIAAIVAVLIADADIVFHVMPVRYAMLTHKGWPLLESMPDGWRIDKTAGSPLHGYSFISDGKSIINGGKRALLRVVAPQRQLLLKEPRQAARTAPEAPRQEKEAAQVIEAFPARTVNELARAKFKLQLLNDILVDLTVCEIEGWCKSEYIAELKALINSIGQQTCIDVVSSKMEPTISEMATVDT